MPERISSGQSVVLRSSLCLNSFTNRMPSEYGEIPAAEKLKQATRTTFTFPLHCPSRKIKQGIYDQLLVNKFSAFCLGQFCSILTMTNKNHSILSPGQTENSNVFLKSCGIFQWEDIAGFMLPVNNVSLGENFSRLNSCLGWSNKLIMGVVHHHLSQGHTSL